MSNKSFEIHSLGEILINSQYGLNIPSSDDGTVPIFKMNNFNQGKMDPSNLDKVKISADELKHYKLEKGDILFNRTNSLDLVGKAGIFDLDGEYVFASYLVRLKVNPKLACAKYINYFLNKDSTKRKLKALATAGVSQANINPTQLKKRLFIPLSSKAEQKKIAKILSTWDNAIATTEKLLANSQQQKKALMQQLLTGKKRLLDKNGVRFSGEWESCLFNEAFKIKNKKSSQIKLSDYVESGPIPIVDQSQKLIAGYCNSKDYYSDVPVIVFGDHTRCIKWIDFIFCPGADGTQVLNTKEDLDKKFGYYLLCNTDIPNLGYSRHMRELKEKKFKISLSLEEQQKIAGILSTADQEITTLQEKLNCLKQEKTALMQQLLTGKRRVKI